MPWEITTLPKKLDWTGRQYGRLIVLNETSPIVRTYRRFRVRCDCGNELTVSASDLGSGNTKSCGYHRNGINSTHGHTRGMTKGKTASPEYHSWRAMLERCKNPKNNSYKYCGALGVTVCERWHRFENFLADMGHRPSPKHSIDRYPDNNGNYEPCNCRWATAREQYDNLRRQARPPHNKKAS